MSNFYFRSTMHQNGLCKTILKLFVLACLVFPIAGCEQASLKDGNAERESIFQYNQTMNGAAKNRQDSTTDHLNDLSIRNSNTHRSRINIFSKHYHPNLLHFIETVPSLEAGVEHIELNNDTVTIRLIANEKVNYFEDAGDLSFTWRYDYFHDIYSTLFLYEQVNTVVVYYAYEPYSDLPALGDNDPMILKDGMPRKWYFPDLNYYMHVGHEQPFCFDVEGFVLPAYMDSLSDHVIGEINSTE